MCVKSLMSGMAIGNAFFQFGNIETFWYMYPHKVGCISPMVILFEFHRDEKHREDANHFRFQTEPETVYPHALRDAFTA